MLQGLDSTVWIVTLNGLNIYHPTTDDFERIGELKFKNQIINCLFRDNKIMYGLVRQMAYAYTNYGTATGLVVKNDAAGYARQTYFKFNLSSITKPVIKATLRLYSTSGNSAAILRKEIIFLPFRLKTQKQQKRF